MAHTLSIIIPVYNTSAFLEKCVESVLKQNVEMEIILIDDGSTDDSRPFATVWLFAMQGSRSFIRPIPGYLPQETELWIFAKANI